MERVVAAVGGIAAAEVSSATGALAPRLPETDWATGAENESVWAVEAISSGTAELTETWSRRGWPAESTVKVCLAPG